jgi:outer membrane immunogenic protein
MKFAFSVAALLASSLGALAADLPARTEAPAPLPPSFALAPLSSIYGASDWSGFYAGGALSVRPPSGKSSLSAGNYAFPENGVGDDVSLNNRTTLPSDFDGKRRGNTFGGTLFGGYNLQINSYVYGVETDVTYSLDRSKRSGSLAVDGSYNSTEDDDTSAASGNLAITQTSRLRADGSLRARIGLTAPNLLVFATGGVALGRFERQTGINGAVVFTSQDGATQATHTFAGKSESNKIRLGWTVGAGADYKLTDSWTLRADYRYTSFGKSQSSFSSTSTCTGLNCADLPAAPATASTRSTDVFHAVRVGMSYQFGNDILPTNIFTR